MKNNNSSNQNGCGCGCLSVTCCLVLLLLAGMGETVMLTTVLVIFVLLAIYYICVQGSLKNKNVKNDIDKVDEVDEIDENDCSEETIVSEEEIPAQKKEEKTIITKLCPFCGAILAIGSVYCEECGNKVGKTKSFTINKILDKAVYYKKYTIGAIIGIAIIIISCLAGLVGNIVENYGLMSMPNVVNMTGAEAIQTLEDLGINDNNIEFMCDGDVNIKAAKSDKYIVTEQSPVAQTTIDDTSMIYLVAKTNEQFAEELINNSIYDSVENACNNLKEIDYDVYFIKDEKISINDNEKISDLINGEYYIKDIDNLNTTDKLVSFNIDTKENIEKEIKDNLNKYIGENAAKAYTSIYPIALIDYDDDSILIDANDYILQKIKKISLADKSASVVVKSKSEIEREALKKELKNKIPYKGLSESYVEDTYVGKADDIYESDDYTEYSWESDDGYIPLVVTCKDGVVTKVKKNFKDVYWQSELPDFSADKKKIDGINGGGYVWISDYAECYHSNQYCSNMSHPYQITLKSAKNAGYRACSKCY